MRTFAPALAVTLSLALAAAGVLPAAAQETIVMEDDAATMTADEPGACGCRDMQSPPWHGNVAGEPCGPSCPPPTMFHANPCGQLCMKHTARQHGHILPPCFPRLHGFLAEGSWPTPRPITLPRCPRCGMHIEGGF